MEPPHPRLPAFDAVRPFALKLNRNLRLVVGPEELLLVDRGTALGPPPPQRVVEPLPDQPTALHLYDVPDGLRWSYDGIESARVTGPSMWLSLWYNQPRQCGVIRLRHRDQGRLLLLVPHPGQLALAVRSLSEKLGRRLVVDAGLRRRGMPARARETQGGDPPVDL